MLVFIYFFFNIKNKQHKLNIFVTSSFIELGNKFEEENNVNKIEPQKPLMLIFFLSFLYSYTKPKYISHIIFYGYYI